MKHSTHRERLAEELLSIEESLGMLRDRCGDRWLRQWLHEYASSCDTLEHISFGVRDAAQNMAVTIWVYALRKRRLEPEHGPRDDEELKTWDLDLLAGGNDADLSAMREMRDAAVRYDLLAALKAARRLSRETA
jgi:hypothetical protein